MKRRPVWSAARSRRVVQLIALMAFVGCLSGCADSPGWQPGWSVKLFFLIDPLILIGTWLAAHAVPTILLASLATILVTAVLGRVFCGWLCPLGTLHAVAGWFFQRFWPQSKTPRALVALAVDQVLSA